uniref:Uncharacterized protein n=1 Tax=Schistosoma curassoni TaxID=6186 RepID=A0A183JGS6_9TREM
MVLSVFRISLMSGCSLILLPVENKLLEFQLCLISMKICF